MVNINTFSEYDITNIHIKEKIWKLKKKSGIFMDFNIDRTPFSGI